jgi:2-dehydropantoate 2-reductase
MKEMKIAIIGPGSIGLLFSGMLYGKAEITIVDYRPGRAEMINEKGIRWEGSGGDVLLKIPVTCGLDASAGYDLVILSVKAHQTYSAVMELKKTGFAGNLLTLQNGLGNIEIISDNLPGVNLLAGITSEGATLVGPGHVRHAGRGKTSFGQVFPGRPGTEFIAGLIRLMNACGFNVELEPDVRSIIWGKLMINTGINALTAILNVRNGGLLELESAGRLMSLLVGEAAAVAAGLDIILPYHDPLARVREVCRLTSENYSSMHQDISRGARTEIDFINGAIVREGKKLSITCPFNESVTELVHGLEEKRTGSAS